MTVPSSLPHNCGMLTPADEHAEAADEMSARQSTCIFTEMELEQSKTPYFTLPYLWGKQPAEQATEHGGR